MSNAFENVFCTLPLLIQVGCPDPISICVFPSPFFFMEIFNFLFLSQALRKIGLESLVMIGSVSMTFKTDYLNRVRMNTVQGFQIFSPIGFMMYPCDVTKLCKECDSCDVSQASGYFDKFNVDVLAFYSGDYVEGLKLFASTLTIVIFLFFYGYLQPENCLNLKCLLYGRTMILNYW